MFRVLRGGAGAVPLLCLAGGVADADTFPVADVSQSADTGDGWASQRLVDPMTINSVPNTAATAFTREGFVTGKAAATNGGVAGNSGTLMLGLQLGCQVDLSEGARVAISGSTPASTATP